MGWSGPSVAFFVVIAYGLGWASFIGLRALGLPFVICGNAGMVGPAIGALAVRLVRREPLRGLGLWPLGRFRWYAAAYLIPPVLIVLGAGLNLATGYEHWAPHLPVPAGISPELILILGAVQALTLGAVIDLPLTLGEELGWRGHLLPRLAPLGVRRRRS